MHVLIGVIVLSSIAADPSGDAVIRGKAGKSEIVIRTTTRLAGAIHSLTWDGVEFVDSADHGRQIQSAANFDAGAPFAPEVFNPTEAGSRRDGAGKTSTSRLLEIEAKGNTLKTVNQPAFWLVPGEKSSGNPALNTKPLSDHLIKKTVTIGWGKLPNVVEYDVTFVVPPGEGHRYAQFEAVTGYMPPRFSRFLTFDPRTGKIAPLSDGPGEQRLPVILSTPDGSHAMGIYSPDQPSKGFEGAGYGRFRFRDAKVVKWNSVFRVRDPNGVKPGEYRFRNYIPVGTLEDVRVSLVELHRTFHSSKK